MNYGEQQPELHTQSLCGCIKMGCSVRTEYTGGLGPCNAMIQTENSSKASRTYVLI